MDTQLPLFTLRFIAIAFPLKLGDPPMRVFELVDFDDKVVGYAFEVIGDHHATK